MTEIILYWRIPSKKNSMFTTKKWFKIPSKKYQEWEKEQKQFLINNYSDIELINHPIKISYILYLPDKRKTDITNKLESVNDLLVRAWILEDDNTNIIAHIDAVCLWTDKDNPRIHLIINKIED